ncbi:organomercurial lyase [Mycetocola saprophilus]|uniref:organomercurial lyase n=1 Tax=Mycetocola saprophilus TaxID=76636 RepID=UPI0004C1A72C|nr:organomercurial lyase [Mycetocola saprophilus]
MSDISTTERVRLAIYRHFARTGQASTPDSVAERLNIGPEEADAAFDALILDRHIAVSPEGEIVLAHPFATRNFGFSVMGERVLWWGGCAWDSFAIPHLVPEEPAVVVATTCPHCDAAHSWTVTRDAAPEGDQVVHFLMPMGRVWDDVIHACANQRIFCSVDCVEDWARASGHEVGAIFDLRTLWNLSAQWYAGRLDPGYVRREPLVAAEYFAGVGLTGPFWGTPALTANP